MQPAFNKGWAFFLFQDIPIKFEDFLCRILGDDKS
jgi:hypothetical protein